MEDYSDSELKAFEERWKTERFWRYAATIKNDQQKRFGEKYFWKTIIGVFVIVFGFVVLINVFSR